MTKLSQHEKSGFAARIRRQRSQNRTPKPLLHFVPNMFTILGLCAGMTAIRYGMDERFGLAVFLIIGAAVLDGLDGRAARLLRISSRLGAELDSLADFLSFGVAPAVIIYLWTLHDVRGVGWAIALIFATCCALRLARFNSELEDPDKPEYTKHFFTGIPAPAGGLLILIPIMLSLELGDVTRGWWLNAIFTLLIGLLMVSTVPTYSAKKVKIGSQYTIPVMAAAAVLIAFLLTEPWLTLSVLGLLYLAHIPVAMFYARRMRLAEEASKARETSSIELNERRG